MHGVYARAARNEKLLCHWNKYILNEQKKTKKYFVSPVLHRRRAFINEWDTWNGRLRLFIYKLQSFRRAAILLPQRQNEQRKANDEKKTKERNEGKKCLRIVPYSLWTLLVCALVPAARAFYTLFFIFFTTFFRWEFQRPPQPHKFSYFFSCFLGAKLTHTHRHTRSDSQTKEIAICCDGEGE